MPRFRRCLVVHNTEWVRLQKQAGSLQKSTDQAQSEERKQYLKSMNEQSKEWTKNWPDTVEGCVALHERHIKEDHDKKLAIIKDFREKQKQVKLEHAQAVKERIAEARERIFNTSCHGRQLISAILSSKATEENKALIELKKQIKQKAAEQNKLLEDKIASMSNNLYDLGTKGKDRENRTKQTNKEIARFNKALHKQLLQEQTKAKKQQIKDELEDTRLITLYLKYEAQAREHCKIREQQELAQYEADQKAFREKKLKAEQIGYDINKVWQNYHERVKSETKRVWDKIIKDRFESNDYKKNCEWIAKAQEGEKQAYEDFVETGIKKLEKLQQKNDEKCLKTQMESYKQSLELVEDGKKAEKYNVVKKQCSKLVCDRQCLLTKPRKRIIKDNKGAEYAPKLEKQSFCTSSNKLTEELKKRSKEPSPWNGAKSAHEQFAKKASAVLKECKYKNKALKVVKDYVKLNCLDLTALNISEI